MHALALALVPLLAQLVSTQSTLPTTLHFFPRTSCNTGTSLSYTTVADLYSDSTCHTTPVGTEALYIDGIAEGCAVMAYSDSECSDSALLSQVPIAVGTCQFYGDGNSIGAWTGMCGAAVTAANSSVPTGMATTSSAGTSSMSFSTMMVPANSSMTTATPSTMAMGNITMKTGAGVASPTQTPGLQSSGVSTSGVASLHEDDWARRMLFKALLMMGSAEVMWNFVPV